MTDPHLALDAIGLLPDVEIDIAAAAVQLARVGAPEADYEAASRQLSLLARDSVAEAGRVPDDDLAVRAAVLERVIAERHGFRGDTETYDDPANANLIRVLERRRGLPVALGVIWLHCARAAGWEAHGLDFPGHFLVKLEGGGRHCVLDVFAGGRRMEAPALRKLLKSVEGAKAELRPGLLQPMSTRAVLLRLQQNIKVRRLGVGDLRGALSCAEDMLRIAPDHAGLWRESGLLHQRLDQVSAALGCFERFLELVPSGEAAVRARASIDELRARLH